MHPLAEAAASVPSSAACARPCRSSSADAVDPSGDSRPVLSPLLPPFVREPLFFHEVLGQLQPHHRFADLARARFSSIGIVPFGTGTVSPSSETGSDLDRASSCIADSL